VHFAWIRTDDAHDWLMTWLDDWFIERWLSAPTTRDALRAVRQLQHKPIPSTATHGERAPAASASPLIENRQPSAHEQFGTADDRLETDLRDWVSRFVADHVERGVVPTLRAAFDIAKQHFPSINRYWFESVYKPMRPRSWSSHGRRTGSHNVKGRE
jgi:hypothetical protein